jgi:hypothetical protein
MTHLAMSEGGADWGDHVTDAEYPHVQLVHIPQAASIPARKATS